MTGVPDHVDGRMLAITEAAGGNIINRDRMWHYTEGIENWSADLDPARHPHSAGPVLDVARRARTAPAGSAVPGFDTLGTLGTSCGPATTIPGSCSTSGSSSEFALSGSEQNPDLTSRSWRGVSARAAPAAGPVKAFLDKGEDFRRARISAELVKRMNALAGDNLLDAAEVRARSRRATARSTIHSPRTCRSPRSAAPAITSATG